MVTMLVAIAVAASMLEGWPDTVVSRTAPRCFQPLSFCSAALLAAAFLGVVGSLRDSHLGKTGVRGFFEGTAAKNKICFLSSRFRKFLLPSQVWFSIQAAAAWCVVSYTSSQFVCEASAACTLGALIYFFALVEYGLVQAAAAWCVVFYTPGQVVCAASAACCTLGALSYFFALVKYGFALSEGFVVTVSGFFGAKGCVGSAPRSSGHVLGLRMLLDVASRLGADTVLPQMRGSSRRFAAPNACDLDVIRRLAAVRAGAACDGVRGVAGIDDDHGVDISVFAFPRIKGVKSQSYGVDAGKRPHIASKAEAEATPRVDVGEVSMTLVSREERQNKPPSFQVFARVDGKTLVVQVWEDMVVSDLRALVACQCYVTKGGKLLTLLSSIHEVGLVKGSTVELHARGVGLAVPGEWYCNHCQRGGCWPARLHCFRCGMARGDGGFGKPEVKEVHHHARLPILGEVRPLLPERKLAKDGLPNLVAKIQSLSVFRPMLSLSC